jgi:hypothetical protein
MKSRAGVWLSLLGMLIAAGLSAEEAVAQSQCVPAATLDAERIQSFQFSHDDRHLLVTLKDGGGAGIWDPAIGRRIFTFPGATAVYRLRNDERIRVYSSATASVEFWSLEPPQRIAVASYGGFERYGRYELQQAGESASGQPLPDRRVVEVQSGEQRAYFKGKANTVVSAQGAWALSIQTATRPSLTFTGQRRNIDGLSPEGVLWSLDHGRRIAVIRHEPVIDQAYASPDGRTLVTAFAWSLIGGEKHTESIKLWDAASGRELANYRGSATPNFVGGGRFLTFNVPDERFHEVLAIASVDQPAQVTRIPAYHWILRVLPDGRFLARARQFSFRSPDPSIDVVDPVSMKAVMTLPGNDSADISEDSRVLITSSYKKGVSLYSLPDLQPLCTFQQPAHWEGSVTLSPGGRYVIHKKGDAIEMYERTDPAMQAERLAAMQKSSEALSSQQKEQGAALFRQAFELFKAGEFEAALIGFRDGLGIDPANALGNFYAGETLSRLNRKDSAAAYYQRTLDLAPGSKEALIARARLGR